MVLIIGFLMILIAGFFQGTFILPMSYTKKWNWENTWFTFSLFGMVILNWLFSFLFIPKLSVIYEAVPASDLFILMLFGFGWGLGAVLFGIGMDKLGMALGYPIIMGLIASIGGLLPLFVLHSGNILEPSGLMLIAGVLVAIAGIIVCSKAATLKSDDASGNGKNRVLTGGIIIAVAAGLLSSLPNIGFSFGSAISQAAVDNGTSPAMAGNAIWALFFSVGFIPNLIYTVFLMAKNRTFGIMLSEMSLKNLGLGFVMAAMWIGSFYLYGYSSFKLGSLGSIIGWPLFISISIVVGNMWGIWQGEWKDSSRKAKSMLNTGLVVLVVAMVIFGISNLF